MALGRSTLTMSLTSRSLDRPSPRIRTVIAEIADHIGPRNSHRPARMDRFDEAPSARVGSVCAYRSGHLPILLYSNEVQQPATDTGPHDPPRSPSIFALASTPTAVSPGTRDLRGRQSRSQRIGATRGSPPTRRNGHRKLTWLRPTALGLHRKGR